MIDLFIYIIGGFLAGVATGLVGLSAAVIIAPMFVTLLGMNPYVAIGIALASDVFASSFSAFHYIKNKNIRLKSAGVMAVTVLIFTIAASYLSSNAKPANLGAMLNIFVVLLGLRFLVFPIQEKQNNTILKFTKSKFIASVFWGAVIGLISGYFGAGGGLSMLAVLTVVLGYNLKSAVGTSVFIMVFTALVGATTHIVIGGTDWLALVITSFSAMVGANIASVYANKINHKILNIVIGSVLVAFGIFLTLSYIL
ncbi:sulfite exporter TauE/SafE family protein [Mycoplasmatota bacterium]|nr:sulfite exporter TauE/SafE family protein [Mycoplasmatota bacterium]